MPFCPVTGRDISLPFELLQLPQDCIALVLEHFVSLRALDGLLEYYLERRNLPAITQINNLVDISNALDLIACERRFRCVNRERSLCTRARLM